MRRAHQTTGLRDSPVQYDFGVASTKPRNSLHVVVLTQSRSPTPERHASIFAVNTLAPFLLTALVERPGRLVNLQQHAPWRRKTLEDIDCVGRQCDPTQCCLESKLWFAASAGARRWPDRPEVGDSAATDTGDGTFTQTRLAVSCDPEPTASGGYGTIAK